MLQPSLSYGNPSGDQSTIVMQAPTDAWSVKNDESQFSHAGMSQ